MPGQTADRDPLPGNEGIGALLAGFLTNLTRRPDEYGAADTARLSTVLLDLTAAMLHQRLGTSPPPGVGRHALLVRIHEHIDRHLGDPALSPATIAGAFHISTRYLHKLFQSQELTVAGWIRRRRLHGARRDLADPSQNDLPIHAIAARWGFPSPAQFSRAFRAAHDLSPAAYRRQAESWQSQRCSALLHRGFTLVDH
ncbi:helix-turn-helix domain-containing protein [Nonomuraea cavernae]|uniref:helix-turn-helix domain-containing protein n=1 Tax=Nonomuraea cavernae TaxID=2045107 RepID=UPI00340C5DFC